ncbi:hypothetical protein M404DRAFT_32108 [Pisolithus tinctorius Marx 270]|uniref:Uncharacterized protein n=1 Tax=Pisolithus tinctorius Marx 270 TaxID=870435 RepID=A0A0C3NPY0_PISTI|nr:hypothetical protein M404DRAFT_32108 [Pisolithus tinctorius Marx 270]
MSFLPSANHPLGADLWTGDLQTIVRNRVPVHGLQQWECFPTSLCHMVEWATVARHPCAPDRRRSHLLVYKTLPVPEPYDAMYPVSVRIYGFLDKFCVGEFGNWNGDSTRAAYAVQSLSLSSMGNTAAWRNQLDRLNLAATFASRVLKVPLPSVQFRHHLHMQRKVFTKRLFDLQESQARHLSPIHDASAQNAHVPRLPEYPWEWNGPLEILEMQQDGNIMPIHEVLLSRGDFVEIDAEFDLVVVRTHATRAHLRVFLTCKQILRLQSARPTQPSGTPMVTTSPTEIRRMRTNQTSENLPSIHPPEPNTLDQVSPSTLQRIRRHSTAFMPINSAPIE